MSTSNCVEAGGGTAAVCEVVVGQSGAQGTFSSLEEVEEGSGVLEHRGLSPCKQKGSTTLGAIFSVTQRTRIYKRLRSPRN
jgi:hypothetical protein